jgi:hypothetical protein
MKTKMLVGLLGAMSFALQSGRAQAPPAPGAGAYQEAPAVEVQGAPAAPADVSPGAAEVIRLSSSGVSEDVVLAYINNSRAAFDLSADEVLYLKDLGISAPIVTAMINHDSSVRAQGPQPGAIQPPPPEQPPQQPIPVVEGPLTPTVQTSPPEDVSYFYNDLSPYGSWVVLDGVGWCWQPRTVVTSRSWRPYCDGGHWVNSDCGWFWQSDYSWGWAPFHYGRWQLHPRCGWVWSPDRVWGPAWVTWRVAGDNCGWAPLPPRAVFDVHGGWRFNGAHVGINFDFGLRPDHFTFVAVRDFTHHDLGHRTLPVQQVRTVYRQTTIINNTTVVNNNTIVNRGIPVERVSAATHTEIHRATLRDLPAGAGRPASGRGSGRDEQVVFRHELQAKPKPLRVEAQRVDDRHPVVQHNELPPVRTVRRDSAGSRLPNSAVNAPRSPGSVRTPPQSAPQSRQAPLPSRDNQPAARDRQPSRDRSAVRETQNNGRNYQASPGNAPAPKTGATAESPRQTKTLEQPRRSATVEQPAYNAPVQSPRQSRQIEQSRPSADDRSSSVRSERPSRSQESRSPSGIQSTPAYSDSRGQSSHNYNPKGYQGSSERYSAPRSERPQSSPSPSSSRGSDSRGGDSGSRKRD